MFNVFTFRRSQQETEDRNRVLELQRKMQETRRKKSAESRRSMEVKSGNLSPDAKRLAKEGCIPLLHPDAHQFRSGPAFSSRDIYLRRYLPGEVRAEVTAQEYRNGHITSTGPYDANSPHIHLNFRPEDRTKEIPNPKAKLSIQTDDARIAKSMNQQRYLTLQSPSQVSVQAQIFRARERQKEIAPQEFRSFNRYFGREAIWPTPGLYSGEKYIDGFEVLGNVRKPRDKSKEISHKEFKSSCSRDPLLDSARPSQSIRSQKAEDFIQKLESLSKDRSQNSISSPLVTSPISLRSPGPKI